jgi:hypothetical protein
MKKTFIVYAERTILESLEVQAKDEAEALEIAAEADNEGWGTLEDLSWEITRASQSDIEDYDEFGVNTQNSFNTPSKGAAHG